ncbi:MAG: lipase, partial [Streptococcus salivarius]
ASIQCMKLRTPENLDRCNQALEEIAKTYGCYFINCNADLVDDRKEQKAEHTYDGVHLYANAYLKVFEVLEPYLLH